MPTTRTIRQGDSYEVEGIVDVITSVEFSAATSPNPIVSALLSAIATQAYEVVVDYKGMRRPSMHDPEDSSGGLWQHQEWQILTYAWLRAQQPDAKRVKSGVLLYLNELVPGVEDMDRLHEEVLGGGPITDLPPTGRDLQALRDWPRSKRRWSAQLDSWSNDVGDWWLTVSDGQQLACLPACRQAAREGRPRIKARSSRCPWRFSRLPGAAVRRRGAWCVRRGTGVRPPPARITALRPRRCGRSGR